MINEEWVLLPPRARNFKTILYVATVAVKGTESALATQAVVYSSNPHILKQIVDEHNKILLDKKKKTDIIAK